MVTAAGAVGLGSIWRFPTLASQNGGGAFLVLYAILVAVIGVLMLAVETALGRYTRSSPIDAFSSFGQKYKYIGWLATVSPAIVLSFYCVIGGWIVGYTGGYLSGADMTADGLFSDFAGSYTSVICFLVFLVSTMAILAKGVKEGIEKVSIIFMPVLLIILTGLVIYTFIQYGYSDGVRFFLLFHPEDISMKTYVAALGQVFFSMSIGTGIMITYGSYMEKDVGVERSASIVGILQVLVGFLSGLFIVPMVYGTYGADVPGGSGLIFESLPSAFASIPFGNIVAIAFFILLFVAAITSAVSMGEVVVATIVDRTSLDRKKAVALYSIPTAILGAIICLGFGPLSSVRINGLGLLEATDYIASNLLGPLNGLLICIFVGHIIGTKVVEKEIESSGKFRMKPIFPLMMKWIGPLMMATVFVSMTGLLPI